jgi:feruloyl esterase
MVKWAGLALVGLCAAAAAGAQLTGGGATACTALGSLSLDSSQVASASVVEAGALVLDAQQPDPILKKLPAFCRVVAVSKPSPGSNIRIEVWLPLAGWNGKFMGQGNGGFAGSIGYRGLAVAVLGGFASGGTDTGHTGGATDSGWALGHPEKVIDFGYRAVHLMTELSKTVVEKFYGGAAQHTYFSSCSDGGREALMEAQRFPEDYDGILAGAPAFNWTSLLSRGAQLSQQLRAGPENYLPAAKVPAISDAVLAACHKNEPGPYLADPRSCRFSPDALLCKGAETAACLTPAQAASVQALYAGSYLADGKLVYPGLLPGGELGDNGWPGWITGDSLDSSAGSAYGVGYFRNVVYSKADWQLKDFELGRDLKMAKEKTGQALDAVNPDLRPYQARGGKLILYHGWNDAAISPLATIDYVKSVEQAVGREQTDSFVRLFLVPGMQHCGGGPGPTDIGQWGPSFDPALDNAANNITFALEDWVEKGKAPEQVIARGSFEDAGRKVAFAQPVCAYPKAAMYKGSGDRKDASSYVCAGK